MEEWDLQALMSGDVHGELSTTWDDLFPFHSEGGALTTRPSDLHSGLLLDGFLDVYKPFNNSEKIHSFSEEDAMRVKEESHLPLPPPPPPPLSLAQSARSRKRKIRQKKMVEQVTTPDAVSSDTWAWRKYGQKPIKGSPYPRSYYKCSTSKGCPARKQVERSRSDPRMFVVTYSGEHNHARPTRRSTLAGVARQKVQQPLAEVLLSPEMKGEESSSPGSTAGSGLSPTTTPITQAEGCCAMERLMKIYESGQMGTVVSKEGGEEEEEEQEKELFFWDDLAIDYNAVDLVGWDVGFQDLEFDEFR